MKRNTRWKKQWWCPGPWSITHNLCTWHAPIYRRDQL